MERVPQRASSRALPPRRSQPPAPPREGSTPSWGFDPDALQVGMAQTDSTSNGPAENGNGRTGGGGAMPQLPGGEGPFEESVFPGGGLPGGDGGSAAPLGGVSRSPVTIQAEIGPDPSQKQSVYLVVTAIMDPPWHIYSTTQPPGGPTPTTIDIAPSPLFEVGGEPMAVQAPKIHPPDTNVFEVTVEDHKGSVEWLIPITLAEGTDPANLQITGKVEGLACKGGADGACKPFEGDFSARYRPDLEIAPLMKQASESQKTTDTTPSDQEAFNTVEEVKVRNIWQAVGYAFLGGLILNIMPCVLPVIGLKILSFFNQAGKSRARAFLLNLWYSFGLLSVFLVLAFMSVGLNRLFTYSLFNIIMSIVIFAMALSLMGVWELRAPAFLGAGRSQKLTQQEGFYGAYYKGIITTLLAIPCGAPLLSPMLVWADAQIRAGATIQVFVVYAVIGLGMASPYLIIGAFPELVSFLPKPGAWMETFKKVMGYFLLVAVVWLLYSMEVANVLPTVTLLFAIWFALWLTGSLPPGVSKKKRTIAWVSGWGVVLIALIISFPVLVERYNLQQGMKSKLVKWGQRAQAKGLLEKKHWNLFSEERMQRGLEGGKPVIVDFTADWCATCKVLEATVLDQPDVLEVIDQKNILTLQADFTNRPPELVKMLNRMGGEQVPVVAIFLPEKPNNPIVLRGMFSKKKFLERLEAIE